MNHKKRKQAYLYAVLSLVFFLAMGITLLNRANISNDELIRIDGELNKIEIKKGFGNRERIGKREERNYAILFEIEGQEKTFGVYAGTEQQAKIKKLQMNLLPRNTYSFFLDPTVIEHSPDISLGIRLIKSSDLILYEENMNAHTVFGVMFILLGIVSAGIFYYLGKKKFG